MFNRGRAINHVSHFGMPL